MKKSNKTFLGGLGQSYYDDPTDLYEWLYGSKKGNLLNELKTFMIRNYRGMSGYYIDPGKEVELTYLSQVEKERSESAYFNKTTQFKEEDVSYKLNKLGLRTSGIDFIKDFSSISEQDVIKGINHAHIKGRFDIINTKPFVVTDVAHNQEASINLASNFSEKKLTGKTIAVFSIMADKDIQAVVEPLMDIVDEWYITKIQSERSASMEQIEKDLLAKKNKINVYKFDSISLAYQEALNKSQVDDNILMFGSFFVNSEVFQ